MDPSSSSPIDDKSENQQEKVNVNGEVAIAAGEDVKTPSPNKASSIKGKGLRKWRRFKRETTSKEATSSADLHRNLKRGLSSNSQASSKPKGDGSPVTPPAAVEEEEEEGRSSVASATPATAVDDGGDEDDGDEDDPKKLQLPALDPELGILVTETGFSLGCFDSDNSEDRSTKSSTAANWPPWQRAELGKERSRGRGWGGGGGGGGYGGLFQQQQLRRGATRAAGSRGRVGSVESEVRSSAVAVGSTSSNGGGSVNYDGGGVREDSGCGSYRENGEGDIDGRNRDGDEEGDKREEGVSFVPHEDQVALLETLGMLQEDLERELQKYRDFENELRSNENEVFSSPSPSPNSDPSALVTSEASQLAEPTEAKDLGHGATAGVPTSPAEEDSAGTLPPQYQEKLDEEKARLENRLKDKAKLEIECMTMRRTIQLWKVAMEDQLALSEEQKSILADYEKLASRLSDSNDISAAELVAQAMELRGSREKLAGKDETLTLQKGALCLLLELIMLCIALWFILSLLMPPSGDFVPT